MTIAFYLDVFVAVLLVATIAYAVILNHKLGRLRADRTAFEKMLKDFAAATNRAEQGVALLQRTADASAAELDAKRDGAVTLRNDLEFLVARANEQADRLEAQISEGRTHERPRARAETTNIFDRLRAEDKPVKSDLPVEPVYTDEQDVESGNAAITPAWLAEARKVAGAEEALR